MPSTRRKVRIADLQPTQNSLSKSGLERAGSETPEVWETKDILLLAEGHHQVYQAHQQRQKTIEVNYHSSYTCFLTKKGYDHLVKEMLESACFLRDAGIFHISQLQVQ